MPRYNLRTLLIVLALGPMALAGGYWAWLKWQDARDLEEWNYTPADSHLPIIWDPEPPANE